MAPISLNQSKKMLIRNSETISPVSFSTSLIELSTQDAIMHFSSWDKSRLWIGPFI